MIDDKKLDILLESFKIKDYNKILDYLDYEKSCGDGLMKKNEIIELFTRILKHLNNE